MSFALTPELIAAINAHALAEFPKECCGLIASGVYFPSLNAAINPEQDFSIPGAMQMQLVGSGFKIEAVVHSHPNGAAYPSEADMKGQIAMGLPWVLVKTDGVTVGKPEVWGGDVEIPALIGREFMHGVRDCYSLIRDVFRLGKEGAKAHGVDWPFDPIELPDFARQDGWWGDQKTLGQTLYVDNFKAAGFTIIAREEARAGDACLIKIHSQTPNHAAVLLADGTILHHLPTRLSRREPAGAWGYGADTWLRYEGVK